MPCSALSCPITATESSSACPPIRDLSFRCLLCREFPPAPGEGADARAGRGGTGPVAVQADQDQGGHGTITTADLDVLLAEYGISEAGTVELFHARHRGARERAWWDSYAGQVNPAYLEYVGYEAGAASIRQFQNSLVPGLLQTPRYADVVTNVGAADARWVTPVTELRFERQSHLASRSEPPRQLFVIDEAVIRRHVGISEDPAIMPDQLGSIARRAEQDTLVTVRVIPFDAGAHPGLFGPFTLLGFGGGCRHPLPGSRPRDIRARNRRSSSGLGAYG